MVLRVITHFEAIQMTKYLGAIDILSCYKLWLHLLLTII